MNKPRLFSSLLLSAALPFCANLRASDHADGPTVAGDQGADLADCYLFQDPVDATKVVILSTVRGFIVPGEAGNFAIFDPTVRTRIQIENTEDAKPDGFIDVRFSRKDSASAQTATVVFTGSAFGGLKLGSKYTGKATAAGLGATPPKGYDGVSDYFPATPQKLKDSKGADVPDVEFFAGETDDPFFFDIPGFARFRNRVLAGEPLATAAVELGRGRDTFAGYNVLTIAFRLPKDLLKNTKSGTTNDTKFGINVLAQRAIERTVKGQKVSSGGFATVDRQGLPAVNALLVPIDKKDFYNGATTIDDAKAFAKGDDRFGIIATLQALGITGTIDDPTTNLGLIASLAVAKGDILRLDTTVPAAFPNGRKPADDVVKTLLSVIAGTTVDDNVPANEVPFATVFPYLGLPHQPLSRSGAPGDPDTNLDDQTRN